MCVCVCVCVQNYGEQLLAQILGALIIISIGLAGSFVVYLALYLVPIQPTVWLLNKYVCMYVCMYIGDRLQENRAQRGPDEKIFFALTHSSASRY